VQGILCVVLAFDLSSQFETGIQNRIGEKTYMMTPTARPTQAPIAIVGKKIPAGTYAIDELSSLCHVGPN
jgi:hypothetical protein